MLTITLIEGVSDYQTESLTQWDSDQTLKISGITFETTPAVHFANKKSGKALVVTPTLSSGVLTVDIPNSLLRDPHPIVAYIYSYDNNSGSTELGITIPVIPRVQPDDYVFTGDKGLLTLAAINAKVDTLISQSTTKVNNLISNGESRLNSLITTKSQELDNLKITKSDELDALKTAKTQEIDSLIQTKTEELDTLKTDKETALDNLISTKTQEIDELKTTKAQELDALGTQLQEDQEAFKTEVDDKLSGAMGAIFAEVTDDALINFRDDDNGLLFRADLLKFFSSMAVSPVEDSSLLMSLHFDALSASTSVQGDDTGNVDISLTQSSAKTSTGITTIDASTAALSVAFKSTPDFTDGLTLEVFSLGLANNAILSSDNKYIILGRSGNSNMSLITDDSAPQGIYAGFNYLKSDGSSVYASSMLGQVEKLNGNVVDAKNSVLLDLDTDRFFHIVVTFATDGTVQFYINGYKENNPYVVSNFLGFDWTVISNGLNIWKGKTDSSILLKSMRIYNRVLTLDEVYQNMRYERKKYNLL